MIARVLVTMAIAMLLQGDGAKRKTRNYTFASGRFSFGVDGTFAGFIKRPKHLQPKKHGPPKHHLPIPRHNNSLMQNHWNEMLKHHERALREMGTESVKDKGIALEAGPSVFAVIWTSWEWAVVEGEIANEAEKANEQTEDGRKKLTKFKRDAAALGKSAMKLEQSLRELDAKIEKRIKNVGSKSKTELAELKAARTLTLQLRTAFRHANAEFGALHQALQAAEKGEWSNHSARLARSHEVLEKQGKILRLDLEPPPIP